MIAWLRPNLCCEFDGYPVTAFLAGNVTLPFRCKLSGTKFEIRDIRDQRRHVGLARPRRLRSPQCHGSCQRQLSAGYRPGGLRQYRTSRIQVCVVSTMRPSTLVPGTNTIKLFPAGRRTGGRMVLIVMSPLLSFLSQCRRRSDWILDRHTCRSAHPRRHRSLLSNFVCDIPFAAGPAASFRQFLSTTTNCLSSHWFSAWLIARSRLVPIRRALI